MATFSGSISASFCSITDNRSKKRVDWEKKFWILSYSALTFANACYIISRSVEATSMEMTHAEKTLTGSKNYGYGHCWWERGSSSANHRYA
jgi:hypothetical protein